MFEENKRMLAFNQAVQSEIYNICSVLFEKTKIAHFSYFRIYDNNKYINLSSRPDWLEKRVANIPNNGKTYLKEIKKATPEDFHYYLWQNSPTDIISKLFYEYNIWNGLSVYLRHQNYVEAWSFGGGREETNLPSFYLNNLNVIKKFIGYFMSYGKKKASLIDIIESEKIYATFAEHVDISPNMDNKRPLDDGICSQKKFVIKTKNGKYIPISKRQHECLNYLTKGLSAKAIARILGLSHRTIEDYLRQLRKKTNYNNSLELLKAYHN